MTFRFTATLDNHTVWAEYADGTLSSQPPELAAYAQEAARRNQIFRPRDVPGHMTLDLSDPVTVFCYLDGHFARMADDGYDVTRSGEVPRAPDVPGTIH